MPELITKPARDLSRNLTFYPDDEQPTSEKLDNSNVGYRACNGRTTSQTGIRQLRLASLHASSQSRPLQVPP
jgi:hypothetical protein